MDIASSINFLKTIETFKTCERVCHTTKPGRAESDAEHSWHLALFLMLIEDELGEVDISKMLKMALIHDLPEIYAGDTNPYRSDTRHKKENEKTAAIQLFSKLPEGVSDKFAALFDEYMDQRTPEARLVKSADKLMPLIQNLCTNERRSSYREKGVEYSEVVSYMETFFSDGVLKDFYTRLLSEADTDGVFHVPLNA